MRFTDYQSKYFAYELTRRAPVDSVDKLASAVAGAQVDLNPHQVDAALFAFNSPLSKGALLADEVGLGKTIEAGLVLSQHWAEGKRRLLVICPANLRMQWHQELTEKFFLACRILEKKSFDLAVADGQFQPFEDDTSVVICSFQFVKSKASYVAGTNWDLVVIDEAHRLRNVYQPSKVVANTIKDSIAPRRKLLLTATPLQNSLLELYGLISIIDEHAFGDVHSFRDQFMTATRDGSFDALKARLKPMCQRTLRRQVEEYVSYTKRSAILEEFTPDEREDALYEMVSEYLRRPNLQALPHAQRSLITMTLRKLLASSTFAIAGALTTMSDRLKKSLQDVTPDRPLDNELADDVDVLDETSEEWQDDQSNDAAPSKDYDAIEAEIRELEAFTELALSIETNAKGDALLRALKVAMDTVASGRAPRKAIIFTESRKTQDYLLRILSDTQWKDGIVLFNGSNTDPKSREIYNSWIVKHKNTDRVVGSRTANMRAALVDYFREEGQIMVATEAAAEGINLQFCALVVNYDLPWNPQRIEQRIGRCHRYGQKHDVVVLNFLNRKNEADQRVYQLLNEKFNLFSGVFGASDDPLGNIESGVDFEKRVFRLYQDCRTPDAIEAEFQQLQLDLAPVIDAKLAITRQRLLENFDDEVREKLRMQKAASVAALSKYERMLMTITQHELRNDAVFGDDGMSRFDLRSNPFEASIPLGVYELPRRREDAHIYRQNHPLAEAAIKRAKHRELPVATVSFSQSEHAGQVTALRKYDGKGGLLTAALLSIDALGQTEEHIILAAITDDGDVLEPDLVQRMLGFPASARQTLPVDDASSLDAIIRRRENEIVRDVGTRNLKFFEQETEKLDGWADDLKNGLEREIKEIDRQLREARKSAKAALTLEEKLAGQKAIKALESQRTHKRKSLFEAHDRVDAQRDELIAAIESKLTRDTNLDRLFTIRWSLE